MHWMILPLKRYAEFSGRSRRKEFWMFMLLQLIVACVLVILTFVTGGSLAALEGSEAASAVAAGSLSFTYILFGIWLLAVIIPSIALNVRRLHDRDMSGWWYLGYIVASFVPVVNLIAFVAYVVVMVLPGTPGPNRYGEDPKGQGMDEVFA